MPRLWVMSVRAAALALAVVFTGAPMDVLGAPLFHGALRIRPAPGSINRESGIGSLRVRNWELVEISDSNGIFPDREPVIIAIGDTERLVVPAGEVKASANGKRFTYRNPGIDRGIRFFQMQRMPSPSGSTNTRYRVRFTVVGIDLSALTIEYPVCKSLAVIVGDDDGFSGVLLTRPGPNFCCSRVRVVSDCQATAWPWV
jgi:hypothetical protein